MRTIERRNRPARTLLFPALALAAGVVLLCAQLAEAQPRHARALPRFSGKMVDGTQGGSDLLAGRRGLVFVFNPGDEEAARAARLLARFASEASDANIALLGVTPSVSPDRIDVFLKAAGLEMPVMLDSGGAAAVRLGVPRRRAGVLVVNSVGQLIGGFAGFESADPALDGYYENQIREALKLVEVEGSVAPALGVRPLAPDFDVLGLDGSSKTLADVKGKVAVLVFFLPTCPHCHDALKFLERLSKKVDHPDLEIIPISVNSQKAVIQEMIAEFGLGFPHYMDRAGKAQRDFAHRYSVPDLLILDREGRVVGRHGGTTPRIEALVTMEVRQALGIDNAILLDARGYSGAEFCQVCHENQHSTWSLTSHAYAFDTLVTHGSDSDPECLPCHTVGWEAPGGFSLDNPAPHLEGVQCENCHGRGGPHQSPGFAKAGFEATCLGCHTNEHSLRFVFEERIAMISHAANTQFAHLSVAERQALLAKRDKRERTLFESADFVGSDTCLACHTDEHALWAKSAHAGAFETLEKRDEAQNADCQRCHTTGFGETTGWTPDKPALAGVGCESCHGPGGNHVGENARRDGTILRLTEKCDSCVILQICGSCHDDENDPKFEFELEKKLEHIRHGFRDGKAASGE